MDKSYHLGLQEGLRWLNHEWANGLSVLHSSLEMGETEMAMQASAQLIGLLRATQLACAEEEIGLEHWQESLTAMGTLRGVDVQFHCEGPSFQQCQVLTSLFLAFIPKVLSGTFTLTAHSTKTSLHASAVLPKALAEIKLALAEGKPSAPKFIPFYLALQKGKITLEAQGEGALLEVALV